MLLAMPPPLLLSTSGMVPICHTAGRYSHSVSRRSRAGSVARSSVRYGCGAHAVDTSGLPYERVLCIDECGQDRTPKPLVAVRSHGTAEALPSSWGTEGLTPGAVGGDATSNRTPVLSFAPLLGGSGLPSSRSFLTCSDTEPSREPSIDGSILHVGIAAGSSGRPSVTRPQSGAGATLRELAAATAAAERQSESGGQAAQLCPTLQEVGQPEQHAQGGGPGRQCASSRQGQAGQPGHSSKASQCQAATRSSRGIQFLPWELRNASGAADSAAPDGAVLRSQIGGQGGAEEPGDGAAEEDEEALLALQHAGGAGGGHAWGARQSGRASPTTSHAGGMLSAEASRRGSMMGGGGSGWHSQRSSMMGE